VGYTGHPPLRVRTRYYDRRVGIWCDEIPLPTRKRRKSGDVTRGGTLGRGESGEGKEGLEDGYAGKSMAAGVGEESGDNDPNILSRMKEEWKENQECEASARHANETEDPTTETWLTQMLSVEASEVRSAIGAIILTVPVERAVEPIASSSSSINAFWEHTDKDDDDDDHAGVAQPTGRCRLKEEYLDIISAVNTLRSTIDEERPEGAGYSDHGGNVGSILILQGSSIPASQAMTKNATNLALHGEPQMGTAGNNPRFEDDTAPPATTDADDLLEAVEEQLLTGGRAFLGWDVVIWDGKPTSNEHASHGEGGGGAISDSPYAAKRNAYGERTGIPRVREVLLESVDWSALPPKISNHNENRSRTPTAAAAMDFLSDDDNEDEDDDITFEAGLFRTDLERAGEKGEDDEEMQVEQLQGLLQQAMAIREAGAQMPRGERERYAKRMVGSLLRDV
jgi:Alpha and gamma adaptin binding protein p34